MPGRAHQKLSTIDGSAVSAASPGTHSTGPHPPDARLGRVPPLSPPPASPPPSCRHLTATCAAIILRRRLRHHLRKNAATSAACRTTAPSCSTVAAIAPLCSARAASPAPPLPPWPAPPPPQPLPPRSCRQREAASIRKPFCRARAACSEHVSSTACNELVVSL